MPNGNLCRGTTLIELLLSTMLSLLLLGLLGFIYLAAERQTELQEALRSAHENARLALHSVSIELQTAGFIGCARLTADFPLANATGVVFHPQQTIELEEATGESTRVRVWHRGLRARLLEAPMTVTTVMELSSGFPVEAGALLLISDCRHADLFQVASVARQGGERLTTLQPLRYRYSEAAEVGEWERNTFSVESTGRRDETGHLVSALYLTDLAGRKKEWVEGVQKLKVRELRQAGGRGYSIQVELREKNLLKTEYAFVALRNG